MDQQIIVYEPNEQVKMEVKTDGETVWLTQDQMCRLFGRERSVITKHINNVFKEGELPKEGFVQILHKTSLLGGRPVAIYNLDVVIGMNHLVLQLSGSDSPRRKIGFGAKPSETSDTPYGRAK